MKISRLLVVCALALSSLAFATEKATLEISEVNAQQRLSYNFGRVWVNTMNTVVYNIRNIGTVPLQREGFSISGSYFEAYTNCPAIMAPNQTCDLEIRYWPAFEGAHFGQMQMLFTDKNDLIIDLYGEAYH